MKAKFINEKFEEHSDPIKDLGIGDPIVDKLYDIYEKFKRNFTINNEADFHNIYTEMNELKKIVVYQVVNYFNEKYNIKFVYDKYMWPGSVICKGKIKGHPISAFWSNSGTSVQFELLDNVGSYRTPQCRSISTLEQNFLKMCKKAGIEIK